MAIVISAIKLISTGISSLADHEFRNLSGKFPVAFQAIRNPFLVRAMDNKSGATGDAAQLSEANAWHLASNQQEGLVARLCENEGNKNSDSRMSTLIAKQRDKDGQ